MGFNSGFKGLTFCNSSLSERPIDMNYLHAVVCVCVRVCVFCVSVELYRHEIKTEIF